METQTISPREKRRPDAESSKKRSKTPLRQQYLAEVEVIKRKLGDIESIRQSLGLSKRKMSQLLLVDPSAWTRWTTGDAPPPLVYRSLQWYLALIDRNPEWHPQNSFNRLSQPGRDAVGGLHELERRVDHLQQQIKKDTPRFRRQILLLVLAITFGYGLGLVLPL